jgi:hypothetical protein
MGRWSHLRSAPIQPTAGSVDTPCMKISEAERCPICGSGTLILQGRMLSGRMIRELVCILCKHSWRIDLPELRGSLRP